MVIVKSQNTFPCETKPPEELNIVAKQTVDYFNIAVAAARDKLAASGYGMNVHSLASVNTLNNSVAASFEAVTKDLRKALEAVIESPAIARVVVLNDKGERETFFVTPGGAPLPKVGDARTVSYRSMAGRLAAIEVGTDLELRTPTGVKVYELIGREKLRPGFGLEGWDSRDTIVERPGERPWTIRSLLSLLRELDLPKEDGLVLLDRLLAGDGDDNNISQGIRRSIIERMGLRQQHSLDTYQDEIFRLPLDRQVAILGPPGTGKTTTLVQRLGQKVDHQALEEERSLVGRTLAGHEGHASSWLMFSPTDLLRLYVKEAFNRERIPASDRQVVLWDNYRRSIARDQLEILRSHNSRRGFIEREDLGNLRRSALADPIKWFEDFDLSQRSAFWSDIIDSATRIAENADPRLRALAPALRRICADANKGNSARPFQELNALSRELGDRALQQRTEVRDRLRRALASRLLEDNLLIDKLNEFVRTLAEATEPSDDPDDVDLEDDDDNVGTFRNSREEAFSAYERAFRAKARSIALGRRMGARTRNGRIVEWLAERAPNDETLRQIGATVLLGDALQSLAGPVRQYLRRMTTRYRRFRRTRLAEGVWYQRSTLGSSEIGPLELDIVVLAMLRAGRMLMRDRDLSASINDPALTDLKKIQSLLRNQILVDEATDFSPIQLACMAALCDPEVDSFFVCGDFNQRVTEWGCRKQSDLLWVYDRFDIRHVDVTYRHSRQLNALAHRLTSLSGEDRKAALPEHVDNEGVDPVLGLGLSANTLSSWLADRIGEIESLTTKLPSVAILVNNEEEVQSIANSLNSLLARYNVRCEACLGGKVVGNDNAVRVFDVKHIKGLEFEAVFFVGVDDLAKACPELFDKFLYVGATRAAMYLGITTKGKALPERMLPISDAFVDNWRQGNVPSQ